jgi:hypothetical protein
MVKNSRKKINSARYSSAGGTALRLGCCVWDWRIGDLLSALP